MTGIKSWMWVADRTVILVWLKARGYRVMGLDRAFDPAVIATRDISFSAPFRRWKDMDYFLDITT